MANMPTLKRKNDGTYIVLCRPNEEHQTWQATGEAVRRLALYGVVDGKAFDYRLFHSLKQSGLIHTSRVRLPTVGPLPLSWPTALKEARDALARACRFGAPHEVARCCLSNDLGVAEHVQRLRAASKWRPLDVVSSASNSGLAVAVLTIKLSGRRVGELWLKGQTWLLVGVTPA